MYVSSLSKGNFNHVFVHRICTVFIVSRLTSDAETYHNVVLCDNAMLILYVFALER